MTESVDDFDVDDRLESGFDYEIGQQILKRGAEASITPCVFLGKKAVLKKRWVLFNVFLSEHAYTVINRLAIEEICNIIP